VYVCHLGVSKQTNKENTKTSLRTGHFDKITTGDSMLCADMITAHPSMGHGNYRFARSKFCHVRSNRPKIRSLGAKGKTEHSLAKTAKCSTFFVKLQDLVTHVKSVNSREKQIANIRTGVWCSNNSIFLLIARKSRKQKIFVFAEDR